jgi:hypothetical protein
MGNYCLVARFKWRRCYFTSIYNNQNIRKYEDDE